MTLAWDDLRVFLAVVRTGTLAGAAQDLGVNHSTVFRRLNGLEDGLGVRLFERLPSGYVPTLAGEEMRASAERVEREIDRLDRRVTGRDLRLQGTLVVTTTDTSADGFLGRHLAAFNRAYPGIEIELIVDNQNVNLSKRQADVAIRPTLAPPETLVGRRICDVAFAPYAAKSYMKGRAMDLESLDWLILDESLSHLAADKWRRKHLAGVRSTFKVNSILGLTTACVAGMGAALLPCFLSDGRNELMRLGPVIPDAGTELWLLTHEDLRHTARVRAFMDFMADALMGDVDMLEGRMG